MKNFLNGLKTRLEENIDYDWSSNLSFGFRPKPAFYVNCEMLKTFKPDNSNSFIVKLKRVVDNLYMVWVTKKYQSDMLNNIIHFCEPNSYERKLHHYPNNDVINIAPPVGNLSIKEQQKLHPNWWWET